MIETDVKFSEEIKQKLALEELPFTEEDYKKAYNGFYNRFLKRVVDFVVAFIGFCVCLPFMLIISLCVVIDSGFPIFYTPLRGGYKGKSFKIFKFRTMVKDADKIGSGTTALNDSRITKVGAFLRKTKFDETAQLLNILNGTMSFIGPRPELLRYTDQYDETEKNILNVRPGITDFSSMDFINLDEIVGTENTDEMYEKYVLKRKNQLRLKYVAQVSASTDIKIFFSTVFKVSNKALHTIRGKK